MVKQILACGGGVILGLAIVGTAYKFYKDYVQKKAESDAADEAGRLAERLKKEAEGTKRFEQLLDERTYVDTLNAKELTQWFRDNKDRHGASAKMVIAIPTEDTLKGLGYIPDEQFDKDTHILQFFYDAQTKQVLSARLISCLEINPNLHASLLEQDGIMVVTE